MPINKDACTDALLSVFGYGSLTSNDYQHKIPGVMAMPSVFHRLTWLAITFSVAIFVPLDTKYHPL